MMPAPARSCGNGSGVRPRWSRLLPLLLILSLSVSVIDCVRIESRSAAIARLIQRPPRRHRRSRSART